MNQPRILLKIVDKEGKKVKTVTTLKTKRIHSILKAHKNSDCMFKLLVRYETGFKNEGFYYTKEDLILALKAFTEPD